MEGQTLVKGDHGPYKLETLDKPLGEVCHQCGYPFDNDSREVYASDVSYFIFCSRACIEKYSPDYYPERASDGSPLA